MSNSVINMKILEALNRNEEEERQHRIKVLLAKADLAAAWGVPDNESTGYSQSELVSIIRELSNTIKNMGR